MNPSEWCTTDAGRRVLIVPHLDGEILDETSAVEELLLWLRSDPSDADATALDPGGVFDAGADALGTLRLAMLRTPPSVAYAPDRRWEHVHLQLLDVPAAAVEDYGNAVAALVECRTPRSKHSWLADELDDYAASCCTISDAFVDVATRFHALTALDWSEDHDIASVPLGRARESGRAVVLTPVEDAAYRRLCDRFVSAWHHDDSLARWMYGLDHQATRRPARQRTVMPAPWQRDDRRGFVR